LEALKRFDWRFLLGTTHIIAVKWLLLLLRDQALELGHQWLLGEHQLNFIL
jgi:hypothetical protein